MKKKSKKFFIINSADFFILFHGSPEKGPCQHFSCDSKDEISLVFHPWTFKEIDLIEDYAVYNSVVDVGIFLPFGISETHQDIKDEKERGMPFNRIEERSVLIHDFCFSPCNCHVLLEKENDFPYYGFLSFANKRISGELIFTYHVVCANKKSEEILKKIVYKSKTIYELVSNSKGVINEKILNNLIKFFN